MNLEVTYLEPDTYEREEVCKAFKELFHQAGFQANITPVRSATDVREAIQIDRCDVFISDLSLSPNVSENWGGLAVIDEIKRDFPYVFIIATTGGFPRYGVIDARQRSFDLFVPKSALKQLRVSRDPNYVARLAGRLRPLPRIDVHIDGNLNAPLSVSAPSLRELQILVRQVFASTGPIVVGCCPSDVILVPVGGGRSRSLVFLMTGTGTRGEVAHVRTIVKVSYLSDYQREYDRYQKFIKWSLPYDARVDVLGTGRTKEWGAIAYSFAHGGRKPIQTLTSLLADGSHEKSIVAIRKIFEAARSLWISVPAGSPQDTVGSRYFSRYFEDHAAFEDHVEEMIHNIGGAGHSVTLDRWSMQIDGIRYPNVVRRLVGDTTMSGGWSICHGDLNTNNVIVSEDSNIVFIDFRDSQIGHAFEDMVTLEGCIRLHWPWADCAEGGDTLQLLIEQELEMNSLGPIHLTDPGWNMISAIRDGAFGIFPKESKESYLFGLAYYCLRLLRLRGLPPRVILRLIAAMLAAAKYVYRSDAVVASE
jgi:hypothetical protein